MKQGNCDIPALTGLRGIAALWVFAFHAMFLFHPLKAVGGSGDLGVDVFFVLSGFVLALNYADTGTHLTPAAWGSFLWKRLARIYPVHLAGLALVGLVALAFVPLGVEFGRLSMSGLSRSITLTHAWTMPVMRTWNVASWSISCEWAAYLAFPIIALASSAIRKPLWILAILGLLTAFMYEHITGGAYDGTMSYGPVRIACEFPAGVLVYRLWRMRPSTSRTWDTVATLGLVSLLAGTTALSYHRYSRDFVYTALPAACLIVYSLARAQGPLERLLSMSWAQWAGRVSYSFYMVHLTVISAVAQIVALYGWSGRYSLACAVGTALIITITLSHWFYASIEQPSRSLMLSANIPKTIQSLTSA